MKRKNKAIQNCKISNLILGPNISILAGTDEIKAIGKIVTLPEAVAFPISPQSIRVSNYNKPVQMVIYGNSYEELEEIQNNVIRKLRSNRNLSRIESD